jgi:hypothetical protein
MRKALGQPVIIENKPGGGCTVAYTYVAKSKPDGYTVGYLALGSLINNYLMYDVKYEPLKSFVYIAGIAELTGSVTNLLLTDSSRSILSVLHPISPGDRVKRPLLPGLTYLPPENRPSRAVRSSGCVTVAPLEGYDGITPVNRAVEAWYELTIAEREVASLRVTLFPWRTLKIGFSTSTKRNRVRWYIPLFMWVAEATGQW